MKCISAIRKLFFFNLLSLLWWPYFCDIRQDDKSPEVSTRHEEYNDLNRIANVPTKQNEINHANVGVESNLKENVVQSSVEFVNSELKVENNDNKATMDIKNIPEAKENVQIESSLPEIKRITLSNKDSNARTNVNNKQEATATKHVPENVQHSSVLPAQADIEPITRGPEVTSPLSQSKPTPEAKVDESSQQPDHKSSIFKKSSPDVPAVELKDIKSDADVKDVPIPAVAVIPEAASAGHQHSQYDGMPSFDEWKKMMLAEQEKGGQKVPSPSPPGKKISSQKRRRNYSSYECGAKIVASNSEAEGTNRILNELVDEYMLNPCKAKIWFVIELCETVQTSQIELANFELFSSCPKDFTVYSSDNFPTRDWVNLGTFTAAEQRVLQSFELKQEGFGKFIKIELTGHYGKEHYCPLSVVRIFGTSMVDDYEEMETLASQPDVPDDDLDRLDIPIEDQGASNIFGSATDAVMNIVKKAAQALGQHQPEEKESNKTSDILNTSETKLCKLLSVDNKCEGSETKNDTYSTIAKIINFTVPLSSAQRSLFRHLHRCDQCLSSHLGYYSSAQPHCRFFQAALGSVMFKALCDWFKEHPLVIPHEVTSSSNGIINGLMSDSTLTITATKSPPPQIMRLPLQDASPYTTSTHSNTSKSMQQNLDTTVTVDMSNISGFRLNKTVDPNRLRSQIVIDPSKTVKISNGMSNDTAVESMSKLTTQILQTETVTAPSITSEYKLEEVEPTSTITLLEETSVHVSSNEPADSKSFKKPKDEIDQLSEMLLETTTMSPEDLVTQDTMIGSDFSSKVDERLLDGRSDSQGKQDSTSVPGMGSASAGQKESVFIRMGNRIKALEINMSLSSLYLQELSQRYRRQMEDMQRTFNRTIGTLNDTAKKAAEKDLKQQEVINNLQSQVENLTKSVELLLSGRSFVFREMIEMHVCLMVAEAIIMITIMSLCVRRISSARPSTQTTNTASPMSPRLTKRRNSADSSSPPIARKVKRRSCSEEVLVSGEHVLSAEPLTVLAPNQKVKRKNKKRHRGLQHSTSQPSMQQPCVFSSREYPKEAHLDHSSGKPLSVQLRPMCTVHHNTHSCENCHSGAANCTTHPSDKEKRTHAKPLGNLTNGRIETVSHNNDPTKLQKDKEKFSLRKFLQFQKRDSI